MVHKASGLVSIREIIRENLGEISHGDIASLRNSGVLSADQTKQESSNARHIHQPGVACPACEEARTENMQSPQELQNAPFQQAAENWLKLRSFASERARYISPRTFADLRQYLSSLNRFFGPLVLSQIHMGHIRQYQASRASGELSGRKVGANKINQELTALIRVLRYSGCWTPELQAVYMPLQKQETDVPRALTPAQQDYFLAVARSRQEWSFVYWYALLGLQCPLSPNEERFLKIGDVDLRNMVIMIRVGSSKNRYRTRTIPLSDEARWALERMLERAELLGANGPQHYLMPYKNGSVPYPDKPMSPTGIRKPWLAVRNAAGVPWFRPQDLRHTCITRLAEAGTPMPVIADMAGHINMKMQKHYTHISQQAKRKAVQTAFAQKAVAQTGTG